jgi:hypothetical protein
VSGDTGSTAFHWYRFKVPTVKEPVLVAVVVVVLGLAHPADTGPHLTLPVAVVEDWSVAQLSVIELWIESVR